MDLMAFSIENYRRFVERTSVKLHNDLVAFVGPNEAGKSSLLAALTHLNHDQPFARTEIPRRSPGSVPSLSWELQLDPDDQAAIADLHGATSAERITVRKTGSSSRQVEFHPSGPFRDREPRAVTAALVRGHTAAFQRLVALEAIDLELVTRLTDALAERQRPTDEGRALLSSLVGWLSNGRARIEAGELDVSDLEPVTGADWSTSVGMLVESIQQLIALESSPDPADVASQILLARLPELRLLTQEDRNLQSSYDIEAEADAPSPALGHLARLADLDLVALRQDVRDLNYADVTSRRIAANDRLHVVFGESWNQEGVAVQLEVQGAQLLVQVSTPRDRGVSSLDERSDGLRWFAALLAFTHGGRGRPILLADEIETHLHYDAQADLVDVLARQAYTSKVLYTTHSFGCLPNDLGNGVRVVEQIDVGASRLRNGFWEAGAGFSPLLKSMGAAAATFTPSRYAVIGEGPTEAIALPTLFRQVVGARRLGFQIAPGLAGIAASMVPSLSAEAGYVAFVVDGDPGGAANRKLLIKNGVDEDRVVTLTSKDGEALEIEDFFDPTLYAECVTAEMRCWNELPQSFTASDLTSTLRTKSVEKWAHDRSIPAPDKVAVAQRMVNLSGAESIFSPVRADLLRQIYAAVTSALKLPDEQHAGGGSRS